MDWVTDVSEVADRPSWRPPRTEFQALFSGELPQTSLARYRHDGHGSSRAVIHLALFIVYRIFDNSGLCVRESPHPIYRTTLQMNSLCVAKFHSRLFSNPSFNSSPSIICTDVRSSTARSRRPCDNPLLLLWISMFGLGAMRTMYTFVVWDADSSIKFDYSKNRY